MLRIVLCMLIVSVSSALADTGRYRIVWQEKPESEATVIWDQFSGSSPKIYYGKLDQGQNASAYEFSKSPDSSLNFRSMNNQFVKLTGLQPDTNYYFIIIDSLGTSDRMYFRTAPNTKKAFKFIQGGDSRNNRGVRQDGNLLVSKLRPLFVSFGGDLINSGSDSEWQNWFDDWQLTIAADGRVFPIVPVRGNHESSSEIPSLFGLDNASAYYKINVSDGLFCQYLLNSEINTSGSQKSWLQNDLEQNFTNITFLSASYHKPMRPHVSSKSEGDDVYDAWAQLFYDYRFDILAENDSHCVKRTVPVKPDTGSGSDEGFKADSEGYIMIGEGAWGAPLRSADDNKNWTLDSGSFNSFDLLHVHLNRIEVRTVKIDNAPSVSALSELDDTFEIPAGLDIWQANGGAVQTVLPKDRSGAGSNNTQIFPFGSEWKYHDGINAPAAGWITSSFDDSSWKSGTGEFGYGDGDEATVLDYGGDTSSKVLSYYFRKNFSLSSVDDATTLTLDIVYDDGAVVYVNGQEVKRINMPTGEITHTTRAASTSSDNSTTSVIIPSSFLTAGSNTVAVELHNRSGSSSDVSFDGGLNSNQDNSGELGTGIEQTVFAFNGNWSYYDSINAPAAEWKNSTFDDSSWQNGRGELGYGDGDEATVLDYGGDPNNKTVTYYFRKNFSLSSVDTASELTLDLIYDDGCVVYLNGQEVERVNMPGGEITHTTKAASVVSNNATATVVIPAHFLTTGSNTLAVEVHNRNLTSSDISFNAKLTSNQNNVGEPEPSEFSIFDFGANWIYSDTGTAPASGWKNTIYDDSSWQSGNGQLGFGDGDETTILDYGGNSSNKNVTYYFRKYFALNSVDSQTLLTMDLVYDDGCIIYVNGQEVKRINMPAGTITHDTFSSSTVSNNATKTIIIPSSYLHTGLNLIAVEVHNRSLGSSDISFDARLISNQNNMSEANIMLFEKGSLWSYFDAGAAEETWFSSSYDDSTWKTGQAQLGFGDGDETTVLDYGGNSSNKNVTYYFRRTFTIHDLSSVDSCTLNLVYDDGCIIYINGQEIKRVNMPSGTITHDTFSSSTVYNNAKASVTVPLSILQQGLNHIAVEVHNRSLESSDISFDADLKITQ